MKKTLVAAALTSLMAGSTLAADLTVYGVVDTGMSYRHNEHVGQESDNSFKMASGQYIGSRFGFKGQEDLGNGTKVGFVLESGISSDTGAIGATHKGRIFGREARLYIEGDFGMVTAGRMGAMMGGNGPMARFGHVVTPFSCGWGDVGGSLQVVSLGYEFIDNVLAYTTPKFAGFDFAMMYSFGSDVDTYGTGTEGKSSVERMGAATLRYQSDKALLSFGVETIDYANLTNDAWEKKRDNAISYNLGGHYDAGFAKFYGYGQIFENYPKAAKATMFGDLNVNPNNAAQIGALKGGVDGVGGIVGVAIPTFGGTTMLSFGYGDFEASHDANIGMKTYQTSIGYNHWITRRTAVYAAADWIKNDYTKTYEAARPSAVDNVYEVVFGLMHKF